MKSFALEDVEDSTVGDFNYSDQLMASKGNAFNTLHNPTAEPVIFRRVGKGSRQKLIVNSSQEALTAHYRLKRIKTLTRKVEMPPHIEEAVSTLCMKFLDLSVKSSRKLNAIVGAAIYAVKRMNNSSVSLREIIETYRVRQKDISKCLLAFRGKGLFTEIPEISVMDVFVQMVQKWFPISLTAKAQPKMEEDTEFRVDPDTALSGPAQAPKMLLVKSGLSIREKLVRAAKTILMVPEVEFSKQGRLPQSVAAGVLAAATEYFGLPIGPREIADKVGISYPTVLENKKLILETIIEHYKKTLDGAETEPGDEREEGRIAMDYIIKKAFAIS